MALRILGLWNSLLESSLERARRGTGVRIAEPIAKGTEQSEIWTFP